MKIGILQTGHVPTELAGEHGEYPVMFERLLAGNGFEFENFAVVDGSFPSSTTDCDGWLITGSAHGAYEGHAFIPPLEAFIREAYGNGIPVAGICFGHQIMAQALGGRVEKFAGGWGVGHTRYTTPEGTREVLAMHQDQVVEKPADAEIIASTDFCRHAGLAYRGKAISFQPHPEFTPEFMRDLIRYKSGRGLPEEQAEKALENLADDNDAALIANQLVRFFKSAQTERAA